MIAGSSQVKPGHDVRKTGLRPGANMMTGSSPVTCDRDLHAVACGRGLHPGMTRDGWACAREQT